MVQQGIVAPQIIVHNVNTFISLFPCNARTNWILAQFWREEKAQVANFCAHVVTFSTARKLFLLLLFVHFSRYSFAANAKFDELNMT